MMVPFGGALRIRLPTAGLIVKDTGPVWVAFGLLESVAVTVRLEVPEVVGVPVIKQLLAAELSPAGSPVIVQL